MVNEDFTVKVGSMVRVKDGPHEDEWRIVPADDSDPANGLISGALADGTCAARTSGR